MRKSTRFGRAAVAAAMLSTLMIVGNPIHAAEAGLSPNNTFRCALAQGMLNRAPDAAADKLLIVLENITGCDLHL